MKIIPKTQKDFDWIDWAPEDIKNNLELVYQKTKDDLEKIKSIPKKDRNFLNTIYALETVGDIECIDAVFADVLFYMSPKKDQRDASLKYYTELSQKMIDLMYDKDLYRAFKEYNPKKDKLSVAEKELYKDQKDFYEKAGFHLPEKYQLELKKILKEKTKISSDFNSNINNFKKIILCSEKELEGLSEEYIKSLEKDEKTGKYIVDTSYPLAGPFMRFAKSDKKRKELADLSATKGGRKNLELLSKLFDLRHKQAKLLGFKTYSELVVSNRMSKSPEAVKNILSETIQKLKLNFLKTENLINQFKSSVTGKKGDKTNYYDSSYYSEAYKNSRYNLDDQKIKEYFELNHTVEEMFKIFSTLFGISFVKNNEIKLWHEDIIIFDIMEKENKISMLILDMFPRDGKYTHMASWGIMSGYFGDYPKNKEYKMPVSMIMGNFPKSTKDNPSLLSRGEVRTLFHEFGHSCHSMLSRAPFESQSGAAIDFDFIETPSQLFENWFNNLQIMESISKHYKTGEKLPKEIIQSIEKIRKDLGSSQEYVTMAHGLLDFDFHSGKKIKNLADYSNKFFKKLGMKDGSPKDLFPASWSHMTDYASSYYGYSISLIYSYDIFSKFKEDGILNKKTGMELRKKILEKGGSMDEFQYLKDFLGRKPNNKAFLKALGI